MSENRENCSWRFSKLISFNCRDWISEMNLKLLENTSKIFTFYFHVHIQLSNGSRRPQHKTSKCLLHTTRTANVAMSKFDQTSPMPYEKLLKNLDVVRSRLGRPLTLSEKVLYSHLDDPQNQGEHIFIYGSWVLFINPNGGVFKLQTVEKIIADVYIF